MASSRRVGKDCSKDADVDLVCRLRNAQALGICPYDEEVPLSAAIGAVELSDCIALGDGNYRWCFANAQLLEIPIGNVKGKQGLFEVDIDDASLPSLQKPMHLTSCLEKGIFHVSMTESELDRQINGWPLVLLECSDGLTHCLSNIESIGGLKSIVLETTSHSIQKELLEASEHEVKINDIEVKAFAFTINL